MTEALYFLLARLQEGRVAESRNWRGKGYGATSRWPRQQGYAAEETYEIDDVEAPDETYGDYGEWEEAGEEDYGETELDEAYYMPTSLRRSPPMSSTWRPKNNMKMPICDALGCTPLVDSTRWRPWLMHQCRVLQPLKPHDRQSPKEKECSRRAVAKAPPPGNPKVERLSLVDKLPLQRSVKCGRGRANCHQNTARSSPTSRQSPSTATSTSPSNNRRLTAMR